MGMNTAIDTTAVPLPEPASLRLWAGLLAQPDAEAAEVLGEQEVPWLREAVQELIAVGLERWQAEHTALFISAQPEPPCPPFESAITEGVMNGEAGETLRRICEHLGFTPWPDLPPDYLGTELELLAWTLDEGYSQGRTLYAHMQGWVPEFARRLAEHAKLRLYRELGERLLEAFEP